MLPNANRTFSSGRQLKPVFHSTETIHANMFICRDILYLRYINFFYHTETIHGGRNANEVEIRIKRVEMERKKRV